MTVAPIIPRYDAAIAVSLMTFAVVSAPLGRRERIDEPLMGLY